MIFHFIISEYYLIFWSFSRLVLLMSNNSEVQTSSLKEVFIQNLNVFPFFLSFFFFEGGGGGGADDREEGGGSTPSILNRAAINWIADLYSQSFWYLRGWIWKVDFNRKVLSFFFVISLCTITLPRNSASTFSRNFLISQDPKFSVGH